MTRSLDYFDPAREFGDDLSRAMAEARCRFLVLSFSSDWRFALNIPKNRQRPGGCPTRCELCGDPFQLGPRRFPGAQ